MTRTTEDTKRRQLRLSWAAGAGTRRARGPGGVLPGYTPEYREQCRRVLDEALATVPAYRSWRKHDVGGEDVFIRLAGLPLLNKGLMRRHGPSGLVHRDRDVDEGLAKSEIEIVPTSGSTGDRVHNAWHQPWWDASEKSSWKLNAHAARANLGGHREAILASPLCVGIPCRNGYLSMRERTRGRFLYLNERVDPREWTPQHMTRMIREIRTFRPAALEANPSYLAWLCRFAAQNRIRITAPRMVVLTYENPSILHLRQIRAVIPAPRASSYGSTEAGYVFMECEHGRLHQNAAHCHVDFLPFLPRHGGPSIGSILVTTFHNPWRSLLRFDVGDIVRLAETPCPCGRNEGLTLAGIEGRALNLTTTLRGRIVTQAEFDRAMAEVPGIAQYQLRQRSPREYHFTHALLGGANGAATRVAVQRALLGVYGRTAQLRIDLVDGIAPDPPGKYRLTGRYTPVPVTTLLDPRFAPAGAG